MAYVEISCMISSSYHCQICIGCSSFDCLTTRPSQSKCEILCQYLAVVCRNDSDIDGLSLGKLCGKPQQTTRTTQVMPLTHESAVKAKRRHSNEWYTVAEDATPTAWGLNVMDHPQNDTTLSGKLPKQYHFRSLSQHQQQSSVVSLCNHDIIDEVFYSNVMELLRLPIFQ